MATKASTYIKNVGKSLGYASIEVLKDYNPVITSFFENNSDLRSSVYKEVKGISKILRDTNKIKNMKYVKLAGDVASTYKNNLFEDIKSGNFYNKEREDRVQSSVGESYVEGMNADFGFADDDFDMGFDTGEESGSSDDTFSMMDEVGEKVSTAVASATARSAEYIVESGRENTAQLYTQNNAIYASIHRGMGTINSNIASILTFYNNATVTHYNNSQQFYTNAENLLKEQTDAIKELLEIEKKKIGEGGKSSSSGNDEPKITFSKLNNYDGAIDLKEYFNYLVKKGKSTSGLEDTFTMIDQMGGIENFAKLFTAAPLRGLTKGAVRAIIGKNMKKSMANLNESLSGLFGNIMANLADKANEDNGIGSYIAKFFGIETGIKDFKSMVNTSNYEKGPIPFDGITKKAIVDVIPHYLSKIYTAISGADETRFDYSSGRYVKLSKVKSSHEDLRKNANSSMMSDVDYKLDADAYGLTGADAKRYNKEKEKIYNYMMKKGFNKFNEKTMKGVILTPDMYGGTMDPESIRAAQIFSQLYGKLTNQDIAKLNTARLTAMDSLNESYEELAKQMQFGSPIMELYNGGSDIGKDNKTGYTPKAYTQSVLDYLYNINKELSFMRQYGSGILVRGRRKKKKNGSQSTDFNGFNPEVSAATAQNANNNSNNSNGTEPSPSSIFTMSEAEWNKFQKEALSHYGENVDLDDESKFENTADLSGLKETATYSILKTAGNIISKPSTLLSGLVNKVDQRLFDLMFKVPIESEEEGGLVNYIASKVKGQFKKLDDWLKENVYDKVKAKNNEDTIKEKVDQFLGLFGFSSNEIKDFFVGNDGVFTNIKNGVADSFRSVGSFLSDKFFSIFGIKKDREKDNTLKKAQNTIDDLIKEADGAGKTEEVPNAAKGLKRVSKTGVVAVSKGEMIVPPDFDIKNIKNRTMRENAAKLKFSEFFGTDSDSIGNYAAGGTINFKKISKRKAKQIIDEQGVDVFLESEEGIRALSRLHIYTYQELKDLVKKKRNENGFMYKSLNKAKAGVNSMKDRAIDEGKKFVNWLADTPGEENIKSFDADKFNNQMGDFVRSAMSEMKDKYPHMITGGIIGAGTSLLTGMIGGPLVGAAVGSGIGLLSSSKKVQEALFGNEDKDGLLPKFIGDAVKKYIPNMGAGAAIGGIAGLIPGMPGGPVTGVILGSAIGFATKNDKIKNFLFGEADENGRGGIFDLNKLKKALPSMGLGSIAGAVVAAAGGPLGLVPSMMLGAGAGLLSTNEKFREYLFGDDGLLTAYKEAIKNAIAPFTDYAKHQMKSFWSFLKKSVTKILDNYVAKPLKGFINKKLEKWFKTSLDKVANFVKNKILKFPANILNNFAEKSRAKGIRKGYEASMTAAERIQYRMDNQKRFKGKDDKYRSFDETLAAMNLGQLEDARDQLELLTDTKKGAHNQLQTANSMVSDIIRDDRYIGNGIAGKISRMYAGKDDNSLKSIKGLIYDENNGLTKKEQDELYKKYGKAIIKRRNAKRALDNLTATKEDARAQLAKQFNIDPSALDNVSLGDYINTEIKSKKDALKNKEQQENTPEKIFRDEITDKVADINKILKKISDEIHNGFNPEKKTVVDGNGRPLQMTKGKKDGEYDIVTNDSTTDTTLKLQEEEKDQQDNMANAISTIGNASSGIADFLGMNDTVSEGKNTLLNQLTEKLHIKKIFKYIGLAATALMFLGSTGFLNDIVQKIANLLPWTHDKSNSSNSGAYGKRGFNYKLDVDGNEHSVSTDSNGNEIVDENGMYTDAETGEKFYSNGGTVEKTVGRSFQDLSIKALSRTFTGINGRKWNLYNTGSRIIKNGDSVIESIIANKGRTYAQTVSETGSMITSGIPKFMQNKLGEQVMEAISDRLDKIFNWLAKTPVVKKASDLFDPIKQKIVSYIEKNVGKLSVKELGEVLQSLSIVLEIVWIVFDFNKGYNDAYSILGVAKGSSKKLTIVDRVLAGLVEAIKNAIPYVGIVGNLIPSSVIVNIVCDVATSSDGRKSLIAAFGTGCYLDNLEEAREESGDIVSQYNNEHGTDYNIEEYNKNVQNDWTPAERVKNWFNSTTKGIKEEGWSKHVSQMWQDDLSLIQSISQSDNPLAKIADILQDGGGTGLFGGLASSINNLTGNSMGLFTEILGYSTKGDIKSIWTSGWDMSSPIDMIVQLVGGLNWRILGTINAIPKFLQNLTRKGIEKLIPSSSKVFDTIDSITSSTSNNGQTIWQRLGNAFKKDKNKSGSGSGIFAGRASGVNDGTFVSQVDSRYANQQFNIPGDTKKQTIADSGCGPAVATMAINTLYKKNEVNMSTASRNALKYKMNDGGVSAEYFGDMFNRYGVSSDYYTGRDKASNIYGSLRAGRQVVLLGQDATNTSKNNSPFGPDSHYVLATGISNNGKYIYINDPEGKKANKRYKASNIINRTQLGISAFMGQGSKLNSRRLPYMYFGGGPTGDYIGKYVKKFESGSNGSTTVGHCGNDGGLSFGSYQMIWSYNGSPGAAQQFWDKYYAGKYGKPSSCDDLKDKWISAANEDPDGFFANEHQFIQSQFYDSARSLLSGFFDPDKYSRAMQECIWSWAVHKGAGGAAAGFKEACSNAGISNPQTADETKLLTACYDQRQASFAAAGYDVPRYKAGYGESSERDIVMGLIGQKPIASDGSTLGTSTATHDSSSSSSSSNNSSQSKGFLGQLTSAFSRLLNKGYGFSAFTGDDDSSSDSNSSSSSSSSGSDVNLDPSGTVGSTIGEKIVNYARQIKDGVRYVYGGNNPPSSTDCSGYTQYVYKQITGADISRGTQTQINSDVTKQVSYADAQPGDLLYWHMKGSDRSADQPSHTGIYLGDNLCIHNSTEGVNVIDNQKLSSNGDMGSGNTLLQVRRLKDSAYAGSGSGLLSRARSYVDNRNRKDIFGIGSGSKIARVGYVAAGSGVTPQSTKAIVPKTSSNQSAINKLNNISSSTSDYKLIKLISIVVQILGKISDNTDNISNIVQLLTTLVTTTSAAGAASSANSQDIDSIKQQLMQTVQQSNSRSDDSELMQLIKNVEALARE